METQRWKGEGGGLFFGTLREEGLYPGVEVGMNTSQEWDVRIERVMAWYRRKSRACTVEHNGESGDLGAGTGRARRRWGRWERDAALEFGAQDVKAIRKAVG